MKDKFIHECEAMENKALTNRIAQLDQKVFQSKIECINNLRFSKNDLSVATKFNI